MRLGLSRVGGIVQTGALVGLLSLTGPPVSEAQELATTFEQLRVLVAPGQRISVTDAGGREITGTLGELSPSALALIVAGARRDLKDSDITTIRQRRPDSLANGAKIGFGIGAALGFITGLTIVGEVDNGFFFVPFAAMLYGGIGAGIGVGYDAMIETNQVIYTKPRSSSALTVSPIGGGGRRGLQLSIRF